MFVPFSIEVCDSELLICCCHSGKATFGLSMVVWAIEILQTSLGHIMLEGNWEGGGMRRGR